jgi:hypothetical protein
MGEHCAQLNACLVANDRESAKSRQFVEAFVRPHGRAVPATPMFADAVESLTADCGAGAAQRTRRTAQPTGSRLLRLILWPVAAFLALDVAAPLVASERDRANAAHHDARRRRAERIRREKAARKAAQQQEKQARASVRRRHKAQRVTDWQRAKLTKKWKRRIGLGQ